MTKSVLNYCPKYWNTLQAFVWINGMFLTWEPFMYLLFFLYFLSFRKSRLHIGCLSSTESWTWLMLHATLFTIFLFFYSNRDSRNRFNCAGEYIEFCKYSIGNAPLFWVTVWCPKYNLSPEAKPVKKYSLKNKGTSKGSSSPCPSSPVSSPPISWCVVGVLGQYGCRRIIYWWWMRR